MDNDDEGGGGDKIAHLIPSPICQSRREKGGVEATATFYFSETQFR